MSLNCFKNKIKFINDAIELELMSQSANKLSDRCFSRNVHPMYKCIKINVEQNDEKFLNNNIRTL